MLTLIRLEAEAPSLATVVKDLDAAEAAVMALQERDPCEDKHYPVPHNTAVTDEHYERARGNGETYFKGRRVLKFLGVTTWDAHGPDPQPRYAAAFSGANSAASAAPTFSVTKSF